MYLYRYLEAVYKLPQYTMARISREHHDDFVPRTPNYGYINSEEFPLGGESINASADYGPQLTRTNQKSLTNLQSRPKVDTSSLSINNTRRAFFEDEYHFVTGRFQASAWDDVKYFGSGTLASDEVSALLDFNDTDQGFGGEAIRHGYGTNRWGFDYDRVLSWYFDWYKPYKEGTQSKYAGDNVITIGNNTLLVDENSGRMVDVWISKPSAECENADGAIITQPDVLFGYGAQSYGDYQVQDSFRAFYDFLASYAISTGTSEEDYALKDLYFDPPLPLTYYNPIPGSAMGQLMYRQVKGITQARSFTPEKIHGFFQQSNAVGCYSKVDIDGDSGSIKAGMYPVDFGGELKGGGATSGDPTAFPYYLYPFTYSNSSVSDYWDSKGVGKGFLDTPINATERGAVDTNQIFNGGQRLYLQKDVNHNGVEGVHRELYGVYLSSKFSIDNYRNSDVYLKSNDVKLSDKIKNKVFDTMKYWHESQADFAGTGGTYNSLLGGTIDGRMNEMYVYSPENKRKIKLSGLPVHKITFSNGTSVSGQEALELGVTFSAFPPLQASSQFRQALKVIYNYKGDNTQGADASGNFMSLAQVVTSGADGYVKFTSKFEGYTDSTSIYGVSPSEHWLGSRKVMVIQERNDDAPGDLSSVAVGKYYVMSPNKGNSPSNVASNWMYPTDIISDITNYAVSGTITDDGTANNGDARATKFSRGLWDNDPYGQKMYMGMQYGSIYAGINSTPFVPQGWTVYQNLVIVGTSADDVINKLENYLSNYTYEESLNAEEVLPAAMIKHNHIAKGGRVY